MKLATPDLYEAWHDTLYVGEMLCLKLLPQYQTHVMESCYTWSLCNKYAWQNYCEAWARVVPLALLPVTNWG